MDRIPKVLLILVILFGDGSAWARRHRWRANGSFQNLAALQPYSDAATSIELTFTPGGAVDTKGHAWTAHGSVPLIAGTAIAADPAGFAHWLPGGAGPFANSGVYYSGPSNTVGSTFSMCIGYIDTDVTVTQDVASSGNGSADGWLYEVAGGAHTNNFFVYDGTENSVGSTGALSNGVVSITCSGFDGTYAYNKTNLNAISKNIRGYVASTGTGDLRLGEGFYNSTTAAQVVWFWVSSVTPSDKLFTLIQTRFLTNAIYQGTVAALGDSITAGSPAHGITTPYPTSLQAALGVAYVVTNYGASGAYVADIAAQWNNSAKATLPTDALVLAGINNIADGQSAEDTYAALTPMLEDVLASGATLRLATLLPWKGAVGWTEAKQAQWGAYNDLLRGFVATHPGSVLVDLAVTMADPGDAQTLNPIYNSSDDEHPNQDGTDFMEVEFYSSAPFAS